MRNPARHKLTVVGGGSWGTAIAAWLARNGHVTRIWARSDSVVDDINLHHQNSRFLPDVNLPEALTAFKRLDEAMEGSSGVVLVVPSHAFEENLTAISQNLSRMRFRPKPVVVWGTKGFQPDSGRLLSEVADSILGNNAFTAVLSGPSFAVEIVAELPAALVVGTHAKDQAESIADWFRNDLVRIYASSDMVGVQLGGALKNVIAIAAGVSDGLGFGINARTALMTRGLAEMCRLGQAMGAKEGTLMGLAGMGDLILTCSGDLSRNRRVGLGLGQGRRMEDILKDIGQEAEGIRTAKAVNGLRQRMKVDMPISTQVYRLLFEGLSALDAVHELMLRDSAKE